MSTVYRFTTFNELLDTVPADRIEDCVNELAVLLVKTAQLRVLIASAAKHIDQDALVPVIRLPEPFEWIDDGKQELTIKLGDEMALKFDPDGGLKEVVR